MSDETKTNYDALIILLDRYRESGAITHGGYIDILNALIRGRDLERQLTAERERANTLLDAIQWLDPQLDMFATDMATRDRNLIAEHLRETAREWRKRVEGGPTQPYAPNNPCPNCGATDRAHTCPNWRGDPTRDQLAKLLIKYFAPSAWATDNRKDDDPIIRVANAIMDAIDARLARGK